MQSSVMLIMRGNIMNFLRRSIHARLQSGNTKKNIDFFSMVMMLNYRTRGLIFRLIKAVFVE